MLLAGRYVAERRVAHGLLGSANKTMHVLSPRHTLEEIAATPEAEAIILPGGRVVITGILQASAAFPLTRGQVVSGRERTQMGLRQNRVDLVHEP